MRMVEKKNYISLDQDQQVRNSTARFENAFRNPFKVIQSTLSTNFIPCKKDSPTTVIRILLFISCHNRADTINAVNKLAK